jgi:hypothetical protein
MGRAHSHAARLTQTGIPRTKEKLRKLPPEDFLWGTFLLEITLTILLPSR